MKKTYNISSIFNPLLSISICFLATERVCSAGTGLPRDKNRTHQIRYNDIIITLVIGYVVMQFVVHIVALFVVCLICTF